MLDLLQIRDRFAQLFDSIKAFLQKDLFQIGGSSFDIASILYFTFSIVAVIFLSTFVKNLLVKKILTRYNMNIGVRQSVGTIVRYSILFLGLFIIIQSTGIDLSTLGLLAGALGVGIGFGLQNITNNFISGIIIMFERPVKIGDRIEVGDIVGNVVNISGRATTIITNDNIAVIIPNSEFIGSKVINWSLNERNIRLNIPVSISYKEDPAKVKILLLDLVKNIPGVLQNPKPDVLFDKFDESNIKLNLRVWTSDFSDSPNVLKSHLYYAVFAKFRENKIEISLPQRDVHIIESGDNIQISSQKDAREEMVLK